jgi:hypothetical protein
MQLIITKFLQPMEQQLQMSSVSQLRVLLETRQGSLLLS